jgi:2-polyprenyl-6-methoxyphenol hydroxylase-like FAD-dependent oxidoreductase
VVVRILIVGAGIAGLSAARALELRGFTPEVVERHSVPAPSGYGIFLLGNATRALGDLGVLRQVERESFEIKGQRILTSGGSLLNHVSTRSVWAECGPCLALPRQALVTILQSALVRTKIGYGKAVVSNIDRGTTREVHFSDGTISHYDLVVAADGIHSQLRATAGGGEPRPLNLSCWRMQVERQHNIDNWTAMLGKGRTLLAIPISSSKLYVYADCPTTDFSDGSMETLKGLFSDFEGPLRPIIDELDSSVPIHRALLQEVPYRRQVISRLVLIGDAAHAASPSMAQGAGMAIEDAVVLGQLVAKGTPCEHLPETFQRRREQRVAWVQKQTHTRDKLRGSSDLLRNTVLRCFGTLLYHKAYTPLTRPL